MTFWTEKLAEFPEAVRAAVEAELVEAGANGFHYTPMRRLLAEEPVLFNGCSAWTSETGKCKESVTHVRYMTTYGRPTYYCEAGAAQWDGSHMAYEETR